ncbi:MAG: histidinol-phosphate transaminase [Candidatus Omnitrophica bacterium]|nr:histidinol-phosphate transaminase [Candidatus Omnitrophota bacterium]
MNLEKVVRKVVSGIKPYTPGKPIEEVKREYNLKNVYKMASNENPLGPSPLAVSAIKKSLAGINLYPDGSCFYLKKALSTKYKLNMENLVIGNGSDELIVLALQAFINSGDEVIIAEPTFLVYKLAATLAEAKVISVPLKNFQYDLAAMKAKITSRTKMIFIANPDNPTGSYVNNKQVADFLKALPKDIIVFFDEAYFEYAENIKDYPNTMKYISQGNIIVSRTFSKIYGLGGMRIGWAAASKEIAGYLNQVREPFNVNSLAQAGAIAALNDKKHIANSRKLVKQGLKFFDQEFRSMDLFFVPSAANFVLVKVGGNSKIVYEKLLRKGIIVREMTAWGLKDFIRITIGNSKENSLFIAELKKILKTKQIK